MVLSAGESSPGGAAEFKHPDIALTKCYKDADRFALAHTVAHVRDAIKEELARSIGKTAVDDVIIALAGVKDVQAALKNLTEENRTELDKAAGRYSAAIIFDEVAREKSSGAIGVQAETQEKKDATIDQRQAKDISAEEKDGKIAQLEAELKRLRAEIVVSDQADGREAQALFEKGESALRTALANSVHMRPGTLRHVLWLLLPRLALSPRRESDRVSLRLLLLNVNDPTCLLSHRGLLAPTPADVEFSAIAWIGEASTSIPPHAELMDVSGSSLSGCISSLARSLLASAGSPVYFVRHLRLYAPRRTDYNPTGMSTNQLQILTVQNTDDLCGVEHTAALKGLLRPTLRCLALLSYPSACDTLAACLKDMPLLQTLDLSRNNIGVGGAKQVAASLEYVPELQILALKGNNIGLEGANAIAAGLKYVPQLQTLDLSRNSIGDEGAKAITSLRRSFMFVA
jgi:hypothetical protein